MEAIGEERGPGQACRLNVIHGVEKIRKEFSEHPEMPGVTIAGAIYEVRTGEVEWLE